MKLRNKKTGEIVVFGEGIVDLRQIGCNNVAEMMDAGWEDYEEPKDDYIRVIESFINYVEEADESFYCDETVQNFAKKLKAWRRLKDARFEFGTSKYNLDEESSNTIAYDGIVTFKGIAYEDFVDDLNLIFGQ